MGRYALELQRGKQAEICFKNIAENRGYDVTFSSRQVDMKDHIDLFLKKNDKTFGIDVKARRKVSRHSDHYDDEHTWVEFKNVRGNQGWLYGKADKIAFERQFDFLIVDREELSKYCETKVSTVFVDKASDALYKCYQRAGRQDVISRVNMDDILYSNIFTKNPKIWKKEVDTKK